MRKGKEREGRERHREIERESGENEREHGGILKGAENEEEGQMNRNMK